MARIVTASDRAVLVVFDEAMTASAARDVRVLSAWLREDAPTGLVDLNPGYASVLVRYDPIACNLDALTAELSRRAAALSARPERAFRSFEIPVRYGGDYGFDLPEVARATGLDEAGVIEAHSSAVYEVRFIGFSPGFPYLSGLPERLRTPRKASPRSHVPAGSVAIAGAQAGIYPCESPGGWNVIGRTEFDLFDPATSTGATLAAGDRVRFRPVEGGA